MDEVDRIRDQWARERPDIDTASMGLIGRLLRLTEHLRSEMARTFAEHGLTPSGFDVLATLRRSGPPYRLPPKQLLAAMMVTSGTMTNRIDQLEKTGLVARIVNREDRRSVLIALTEAGRDLIDQVLDEHVRTQARLVSQLPPDQRADLDGLLRAWLARFEQG